MIGANEERNRREEKNGFGYHGVHGLEEGEVFREFVEVFPPPFIVPHHTVHAHRLDEAILWRDEDYMCFLNIKLLCGRGRAAGRPATPLHRYKSALMRTGDYIAHTLQTAKWRDTTVNGVFVSAATDDCSLAVLHSSLSNHLAHLHATPRPTIRENTLDALQL